MHSSKGETFSLMLPFSGLLHVFLPHFFLFLSFCFPSGFTFSCVHFVTRAFLDPSLPTSLALADILSWQGQLRPPLVKELLPCHEGWFGSQN